MELKTPSLKLNDGHQIPILGLSTTSQTQIKLGEIKTAIMTAIDVGYRHIDCAMVNGNEEEVGQAIKVKVAEGVVKRADLFLTSKVWNTFHGPDSVIPVLKKTLENLQTDYLDLFLIHWPVAFQENEEGNLFPKDDNGSLQFSDADYVDTWQQMEEAVSLGLVRSIGVANFNGQQLQRILDVATIPPATNQIEVHPYLNQEGLLEFCRDNGILVTAYSPLGSTNKRMRAKPGEPTRLLDDSRLLDLAKMYDKTVAQLLLRWLVQRGMITIPEAINDNNVLTEYTAIFDFDLTQGDMRYLATFDRSDGRLHVAKEFERSEHYPFHLKE